MCFEQPFVSSQRVVPNIVQGGILSHVVCEELSVEPKPKKNQPSTRGPVFLVVW